MPTPEALILARQIAADQPHVEAKSRGYFLDGTWDNTPAVQAAKTAIEQTTARIVAWLREHPGEHAKVFADAIEKGEHEGAEADILPA